MAALVLAILITCDAGFTPTVTTTGMVTLPVVAFSTCCPMYVPAMSPFPGRAELVTDTVYVPALVPVAGSTLSHFGEDAVVVATLQLSVPAPPLPTTMVCEGGFAVVGLNEKLVWPGRLSKNALLEPTTAR